MCINDIHYESKWGNVTDNFCRLLWILVEYFENSWLDCLEIVLYNIFDIQHYKRYSSCDSLFPLKWYYQSQGHIMFPFNTFFTYIPEKGSVAVRPPDKQCSRWSIMIPLLLEPLVFYFRYEMCDIKNSEKAFHLSNIKEASDYCKTNSTGWQQQVQAAEQISATRTMGLIHKYLMFFLKPVLKRSPKMKSTYHSCS